MGGADRTREADSGADCLGSDEQRDSRKVHLSDKTVKNYVSNILSKLEVARRSQAAAYMAQRRVRKGVLI